MLIWLFACLQEELVVEQGEKKLQLIYASNMDGEIEPCG